MTEIEYLRKAAKFGMVMSDDLRTRVGALILISDATYLLGANRLSPGVRHTSTRVSPERKDRYIEHAERDVINIAARHGISTDGSTMYAPWFACCGCARAIINAGIREVVGLALLQSMTAHKWSEEIAAAHQMLAEAGVGMRWLTAKIGTTILFDGKEVEI
jgi:dCMP deaminase